MKNTMHEARIPFEVDGQPWPSLLCTPDNLSELAVGRLITEGTARVLGDIRAITRDAEGLHIRMLTDAPPKKTLEERIAQCSPFQNVQPLSARRLQTMRDAQQNYPGAHGTHVVVIMAPQGVEVFEDVARHNALDKAIGHAVLRRWDMASATVLTSGRLSLEIALKCAIAGIPRVYTIKYTSDLAEQFASSIHMQLLSHAGA